jgi:hypothetical protein
MLPALPQIGRGDFFLNKRVSLLVVSGLALLEHTVWSSEIQPPLHVLYSPAHFQESEP